MGAWQGMYWSLISFPLRFPQLVNSGQLSYRHAMALFTPPLFHIVRRYHRERHAHGQAIQMLVNEGNRGETPLPDATAVLCALDIKCSPGPYSSFSFLTTHSLYLIHRSSPISLVFNTSILNYQRK